MSNMAGLLSLPKSKGDKNGSSNHECKKCLEMNSKYTALDYEHQATLNEFQASREIIHLLQRQLDSVQKESESMKDLLKGKNISEDLITKLLATEGKLAQTEEHLGELKKQFTKLSSEHEMLIRSHESNLNQVSLLCDTIEAKDKAIHALSHELYDRDSKSYADMSNGSFEEITAADVSPKKQTNGSKTNGPTTVPSNYDDLGFSNKQPNGNSKVEITESKNSSRKSTPRNSSSTANTSGQVSKLHSAMEANWKLRWDAYIGSLPSSNLERSDELKYLLRTGIPREYRYQIWKGLIDMRVKKQRDGAGPDYYQSLLNAVESNSPATPCSAVDEDGTKDGTIDDKVDKSDSLSRSSSLCPSLITSEEEAEIIKEIELDLLRTLPGNKHFESLESSGTCRLRRVLIAYSRHNPAVGYCQGLNRLAAVSLLFMPEEEAFWALVTIIEYLMPPDYYNATLLGAHVDQHVFFDLLADKMPHLSNHLASFGIEISLFSWFLTCFIDNTPVEVYLRIWDVFLYEGNKILFRFALAFLKLHEAELLACNDSVTINTLLRTKGGNGINVDELFSIAFNSLHPFSMADLESKRAHYTCMVKSDLNRLLNSSSSDNVKGPKIEEIKTQETHLFSDANEDSDENQPLI